MMAGMIGKEPYAPESIILGSNYLAGSAPRGAVVDDDELVAWETTNIRRVKTPHLYGKQPINLWQPDFEGRRGVKAYSQCVLHGTHLSTGWSAAPLLDFLRGTKWGRHLLP